jgi:hypothetical protein
MTESKNLLIWTARDQKLNCRGSRIGLTLASIGKVFFAVSSTTYLRYILWLLANSEANFGKACRLRGTVAGL